MNLSSCLIVMLDIYFYVGNYFPSGTAPLPSSSWCFIYWQDSYVFSVPAHKKLSTGGESQGKKAGPITNLWLPTSTGLSIVAIHSFTGAKMI